LSSQNATHAAIGRAESPMETGEAIAGRNENRSGDAEAGVAAAPAARKANGKSKRLSMTAPHSMG
jgi:ethanolamine ammonia-lyase large subunit